MQSPSKKGTIKVNFIFNKKNNFIYFRNSFFKKALI